MNGSFFRLLRHRNESGFIFPLTLIITFLFFSFLLHQIEMYQSEKHFIHLRGEMLTQEHLIQMATVDIEQTFSSDPPTDNGAFHYENGSVQYEFIDFPDDSYFKDSSPENVVYMKVTAMTKTGSEHVSYVYYDKMKQKIIRWVEAV